MVRIHDALDNATLDSGSTSGATEQDETLGQAAFDLHLDEIPLEQMQEGGVGPSHTVASGDVEHRSVSQQPDMKLVVISTPIIPIPADLPQPSSRSSNVPARSGCSPRRIAATGLSGPCHS